MDAEVAIDGCELATLLKDYGHIFWEVARDVGTDARMTLTALAQGCWSSDGRMPELAAELVIPRSSVSYTEYSGTLEVDINAEAVSDGPVNASVDIFNVDIPGLQMGAKGSAADLAGRDPKFAFDADFAADLGAEKFLDIKCRFAGLTPSAVVVVATVRALKSHGGVPKAELNTENLEALEKGLPNLLQHVENITKVYGLPCVVAINAFPTDTAAELKLVEDKCRELGVNVALSEVWAKGGEGGIALAEEVVRLCDQPNDFRFAYNTEDTIEQKLHDIVTKIYHADGVNYTANAEKQIKTLTALGYDHMPICMAKTQYSFSDDAAKLGAPKGFTITVRNLKVSAGAGFLVALTGDIMTMPGLPKVPAAEKIDVDENGRITGLF